MSHAGHEEGLAIPFYYDSQLSVTAHGTPDTELDHLRTLTVANQESAKIVQLYGGARHTTAGAAQIRLKTFGTPSTVGSAVTPGRRHPSQPAAALTAFSAPTPGSTPVVRVAFGLSQTGGTGGWAALEPMNAITLLANGGANGNADVFSIAKIASLPIDFTLEHSEG